MYALRKLQPTFTFQLENIQLIVPRKPNILLVGKDEDVCLGELLMTEHLVELLLGDGEALAVRGVHNEDDELKKKEQWN